MELTSQVKQALTSRCKHGMVWEYCGQCQRYTYESEYTIYLDKKDKDGSLVIGPNGKPKKWKLSGERTIVEYMRYR